MLCKSVNTNLTYISSERTYYTSSTIKNAVNSEHPQGASELSHGFVEKIPLHAESVAKPRTQTSNTPNASAVSI